MAGVVGEVGAVGWGAVVGVDPVFAPVPDVAPLVVAVPFVCAPPPTPPLAASCCCTAWTSSGEAVVAVQPLLDPPPPTERILMLIPHTFAAIEIGIWALIGIFDLSIFKSSARSLSTFERSTLTSEVATPPTPLARAEPALLTPSTAVDLEVQPDSAASAQTGRMIDLRMTRLPSVTTSANDLLLSLFRSLQSTAIVSELTAGGTRGIVLERAENTAFRS